MIQTNGRFRRHVDRAGKIAALTSLLVLFITSLEAAEESQLETRCGWFSNPTPANMWLTDRDGEWTIGIQGGHQSEGDWEWPKFRKGQWIKTNREYGYGCACFELRVDQETRNVLFIKRAWARPLEACEKDPSLKKQNGM